MTTINQLIALATKNGFESYGSFNEGDSQHEILTCTKGKFSGEVIDLYYDYSSGNVVKVEYSTQFRLDQISPIFCFPKSVYNHGNV